MDIKSQKTTGRSSINFFYSRNCEIEKYIKGKSIYFIEKMKLSYIIKLFIYLFVLEMSDTPCGLFYEDVRAASLVNGFLCPAPDAEGRSCGRRLADHPHAPGKIILSYFVVKNYFFFFSNFKILFSIFVDLLNSIIAVDTTSSSFATPAPVRSFEGNFVFQFHSLHFIRCY